MKKVMVTAPTCVGGVWYEPAPYAQDVADNVADHLVQIGSAQLYETKVEEVAEKKSLSASQAGQVLTDGTPKKRRGRPPRS